MRQQLNNHSPIDFVKVIKSLFSITHLALNLFCPIYQKEKKPPGPDHCRLARPCGTDLQTHKLLLQITFLFEKFW